MTVLFTANLKRSLLHQSAFTCTKLTIEKLEQGVNFEHI